MFNTVSSPSSSGIFFQNSVLEFPKVELGTSIVLMAHLCNAGKGTVRLALEGPCSPPSSPSQPGDGGVVRGATGGGPFVLERRRRALALRGRSYVNLPIRFSPVESKPYFETTLKALVPGGSSIVCSVKLVSKWG
uniref:Uncharacterized protein n=2 Tax=Heterosigma akashiwo TaxID=2829 RepID=A0A7S3XZ88_HETAK